jgi:predicted nucleic acid-binding protein
VILVDTSVWIDYFNGVESRTIEVLDAALDRETVVIGDIIFLEILQGFRHDRDFNRAKNTLGVLEHYELLGNDMVVKCADNYRTLRRKGITIRKTTDIIIATFCIEHKLPLLHSDRDFGPFEKHLGLRTALSET